MVRHSVVLALVVVGLASLARAARAQDSLANEYAVKFVCGAPDRPAVAPGRYFTAINIHNPGLDTVQFRRKYAFTLAGEQPGPIEWDRRPLMLTPDQALEIDCTGIQRVHRAPFLKGFAVLLSPLPLDVVAVYTAAGATGRVETMHLERVPASTFVRRPPGCPDLVVDSIRKPIWDAANNRSVIVAIIRNIGTATAGPSIARVIDPSTPGPTGAPQNAIAATPALAPGDVATVTFYLPYWVFNPDATLEVTADYKNDVVECREDNNMLRFEAKG